MDNTKEQIYEKMMDFIIIQRKIEALLVVLKILQENFEHESKELHGVVSIITWQIDMIYQEYKTAMADIDKILLDKKQDSKKEDEHG